MWHRASSSHRSIRFSLPLSVFTYSYEFALSLVIESSKFLLAFKLSRAILMYGTILVSTRFSTFASLVQLRLCSTSQSNAISPKTITQSAVTFNISSAGLLRPQVEVFIYKSPVIKIFRTPTQFSCLGTSCGHASCQKYHLRNLPGSSTWKHLRCVYFRKQVHTVSCLQRNLCCMSKGSSGQYPTSPHCINAVVAIMLALAECFKDAS